MRDFVGRVAVVTGGGSGIGMGLSRVLARAGMDVVVADTDVESAQLVVELRRRGIHATHEDWAWMIGVNLWGAIHGIEAFLPGMLQSGQSGHIVNTSSANGMSVLCPGVLSGEWVVA